jgi:hypothetical protein
MGSSKFGGKSAIVHTSVVMRDSQSACQDPSRACLDRTCFLEFEKNTTESKGPTKARRARVVAPQESATAWISVVMPLAAQLILRLILRDIERLWLVNLKVYTCRHSSRSRTFLICQDPTEPMLDRRKC